MKIRTGFVSNSSSSSFVLDRSNPEVSKLITKINPQVSTTCHSLGRYTALFDYKETKCLLEDLNALDKRFYVDPNYESLPTIKEWHEKLGEDFVYIRESDENYGGYLFVHLPKEEEEECYALLNDLALHEEEYH